MLLNHMGMTAVLLGVSGWTAKYFSEKGGNVSRMICTHVCKDRRKKRITSNILIETCGNTYERLAAAEPFV